MEALFLLIFIIAGIFIFSAFLKSPSESGEKVIDIKSPDVKKKVRLAVIGIVVLAVIVTLIKGVVVVPAGHRYVVFNVFGGVQDEELGEGIHIIIPYINRVTPYDVRIQEYTMSSVKGEGRRTGPDSLWAPTKEGLQVGVDLTVLYRIDPVNVSELHQNIGPVYETKIIRPAITSTVRHNISNYAIMEVYSAKRKEIENNIFEDLQEQMKVTNIIVNAVKLRDVIFTDKFAASIEQKQVAQQEMERWDYIKQQRKKEAEARIIEAEGKAEAMRRISDEIARNPDIIKYNYVEKISDDIQVIVTDQQTIMDMKGMLK